MRPNLFVGRMSSLFDRFIVSEFIVPLMYLHLQVKASLGPLVYLGNVMLLNENSEKKHAVLGLFEHQVLFMYISSCMSGYEYQVSKRDDLHVFEKYRSL